MVSIQTLRDIPGFADWVTINPIDKGWSKDRKFYIEDRNNSRFLLRVASAREYDRKKMDYERVGSFASLEIPTPRPVDFGLFAGGSKVYTLLTWVDGQEAETVLPRLAAEQQYELGIASGDILHRMHALPAPDGQEPWGEQYRRKIDLIVRKYQDCGVTIPHEKSVIRFLDRNMVYLDDRPQALQHGDYHVGNMVITPKMQIGIIDFNRSDHGDPWEEYDRFMFTWQCSIPFALGQIHGYFHNKVPDEFLRLMCLYAATNTLASIPWAVPFGVDEVKTMLGNAAKVAACYNEFEHYVPAWYVDPAGSVQEENSKH